MSEGVTRTILIPEGKDFKLLRLGRIKVLKGTDSGMELTILKERVVVGRSLLCDLVLTDGAVSKSHAEIIAHESGRVIRDLGSKNGILFMGHQVNELSLKSGTQFQIGNNLLRFEELETQQKIGLSKANHFGKVLGESLSMREVFAILEKVSPSDISVLIQGETGTGKELIANAIHEHSKRSRGPFAVLNCAAIPGNLVESTLFGHVKGAFTGAVSDRRGVFEEANGGTLFLDEIGELPLATQPQLLRAVEQREIQRVGDVKKRFVDIRILAATNKDIRTLVEKNLFREDLMYRLAGIEVRVPPLRERLEDVSLLVRNFLKEKNRIRSGSDLPFVRLEKGTIEFLQSHIWYGNVRELRNVIEGAVNLADGNIIGVEQLQMVMDLSVSGGQSLLVSSIQGPYKDARTRLLKQFERQYLSNLLRECNGNLTQAANKAGLVRHHLRDLCKRNQIPFGTGSYD